MEEMAIYKTGQSVAKTSTKPLMNILQQKESLKIAMFERSLTLQKAIQSTPIHQLIKQEGEEDVMKTIIALVVFNSEYFLVSNKMSDNQAIQIASLFMENYQHETIEDFMMCLKNAKLNKYGTSYNRLDGQVIFQWFQKYLDEKYQEVERLKRLERDKRMEETTQAIGGVGISILEQIKKHQPEPQPEFIQPNSEQQHWENFNQVIKRATIEQLIELKEDYVKHREAGNTTVERYITALNCEISNR